MFNKKRVLKISFLIFVFSIFININISKADSYRTYFNVPGNNAPNSSYIAWVVNNLPKDLVLGDIVTNTARYAGNYVPTGINNSSAAPTT